MGFPIVTLGDPHSHYRWGIRILWIGWSSRDLTMKWGHTGGFLKYVRNFIVRWSLVGCGIICEETCQLRSSRKSKVCQEAYIPFFQKANLFHKSLVLGSNQGNWLNLKINPHNGFVATCIRGFGVCILYRVLYKGLGLKCDKCVQCDCVCACV